MVGGGQVTTLPWEDHPKTYNTYFYGPPDNQEAIDLAVHCVLGILDIFLVSTGDMQLLPRLLDAASRFRRLPSNAEMQELIQKYEVQPIFPN